MRNIILKFLVYSYSYYKAGKNTEDVAYFSAIMAFLVVLTFHYMTFASIFIWDEYTIHFMQFPKWQRYIMVCLFIVAPFYLLIKYFFPESEILKQMGRESNLKRGRLYALGYLVFSIALFLITVWTVKGLIFQ
jgi:hypothetical protein